MTASLLEQLENDIIFGVYAPGTRIVEDRTIERYGATRHSVRRVFSELETRGLLVHIPNRGVEVVQFTPEEVDALYEVRLILETAAARRSKLPADERLIHQLQNIAEKHENAIAQQEFRKVYWLNQEFHAVQFSCCGNPRLAALIEQHARIAQPIRVIKYDDRNHMDIVVAQHHAIIEALSGSSQDRYVEATRKHLPASPQAYRTHYQRRYGKSPDTD